MEPKQEFKQSTTVATGRPLQRIPWAQKMEDSKHWFKQNVEYYISLSNFNFDGTGPTRKDLRLLYQVYNNQFPQKWFNHITDPLSAQDARHKRFPAKMRPVTILRTNLDLLMGEYPKRPFVYQVVNRGEDGYNRYTDALKTSTQSNLTQHFVAEMQKQTQAQGTPTNQIPGLDQIELPPSLKERFNSTYKDAIAIQGQRWLDRALAEYNIQDEFLRMFKDWLIAGRACSYKGILHGTLKYERISPLNLDYDKSPDTIYIEDGEWAVCRRLYTLSDIVDYFYEQLKDEDLHDLENRSQYKSPFAFYQYLQDTYNRDTFTGKIPVYHVVWKGKKKIKIVSFPDPITGEIQEQEHDEDYIANKEIGEKVEEMWVNEVYEGWRVGDNIYPSLQPIPVQRNEMNNLSSCKLPYNGRNYSDLHTENISVLELGLPFQQMYMIINYILEKTIAKSKGKIMQIDINSIPKKDGWTEEKFFYYSEAMGYQMINRNQIGVDKTWNQYHVLDMSLFDQIKQLIELKNNYKQEWDDVIGITRQRKGETAPSDLKSVTEMGLMQSSVITDMIYNFFEEFTEREMQGILDYSKFVNIDGVKSIYNNEDFGSELMNIDPNTYCYAELGIKVSKSTKELAVLNQLKQQLEPLIQQGANASTILEIIQAKNVAELKMKLKTIEDMQAAMSQNEQQSEAQQAQEADERKKEFAQFEHALGLDTISAEWDRRDQNTMIKGEYDVRKMGDIDETEEGGIETAIIEKTKVLADINHKRDKLAQEDRNSQREYSMRKQELEAKVAADKQKAITDRIKARKPSSSK